MITSAISNATVEYTYKNIKRHSRWSECTNQSFFQITRLYHHAISLYISRYFHFK